jgi:hypothetical protein
LFFSGPPSAGFSFEGHMATKASYPRFKVLLPTTSLPASGYKVYTYAAGTTTPLVTYSDVTGATPNANPVILDSNGEADIHFGAALYKIDVRDPVNDQSIGGFPVDNVGIPSLSGSVVNTIADLKALSAGQFPSVQVLGYYAVSNREP